MDHSYFKDRISGYFDNDLPPYEMQILQEHIESCDECQKILKEFETLEKFVAVKSEFDGNEYWEKAARKIEEAVIADKTEKVVDVNRKSFKGLFWKISAAAASIAALTFIALHEDDISKDASQSLNPPIPVKQVGRVPDKLSDSVHEIIASYDADKPDTTPLQKIIREGHPALGDSELADRMIPEKEDDLQFQKQKAGAVLDDEPADEPDIVKDVKPEALESALSSAPTLPAKQKQPEEFTNDVKVKAETPLVIKEKIEQEGKGIKESAQAAEQFYTDGLMANEKTSLDLLRQSVDSLHAVYVEKISKKSKQRSSIASESIIDKTQAVDSVQLDFENVMLDKTFELAQKTSDEKLRARLNVFLENYISDSRSLNIEKAKRYLAELKK